jgi:UDP-N-acetylglucosamine 2-epimerase (non-hydrolysing)
LNKKPVFHVEAGLRTFDDFSPFPEEMNRKLISQIATINFAPTIGARKNLISQGIASGKIIVTGNTVVDATNLGLRKLDIIPFDSSGERKLEVLVTCHRRENFGKPMEEVFLAVLKLLQLWGDVNFTIVRHPNPATKIALDNIFSEFNFPNLTIVEPFTYPEMLKQLSRVFLVITDSGGLQEEVPSFGIPAIVTRSQTERPEGIKSGHLFMCGTDSAEIVEMALRLRNAGRRTLENPYGSGMAAEAIVEALVEYFG